MEREVKFKWRYICKDGRMIYDTFYNVVVVRDVFDPACDMVDPTVGDSVNSVAAYLKALNQDYELYKTVFNQYLKHGRNNKSQARRAKTKNGRASR